MRAITFGLFDSEDSASGARREIENLRGELAGLRALAAGVVARRCRLERELTAERDRLSGLGQGTAEYDSCRERVAGLEAQLEIAGEESARTLAELGRFRETLRQAEKNALETQLNKQLAQIEEIALEHSLDSSFDALERIHDDATDAASRAQALRELNAALGQDSADIQKEETGRQRITDSDSGG